MADIVTSYQTQKESLASDYLKQLETARRAQQLARQQTEEQAALAQRQMQQGLYKRGLVGTGVQQLGQIQGQLALSSQLNQQAMQQSATEQGMYQTYKTNLQALEDKRSATIGQIEALAANSTLRGDSLTTYISNQAQAKGITLTEAEKTAMAANVTEVQNKNDNVSENSTLKSSLQSSYEDIIKTAYDEKLSANPSLSKSYEMRFVTNSREVSALNDYYSKSKYLDPKSPEGISLLGGLNSGNGVESVSWSKSNGARGNLNDIYTIKFVGGASAEVDGLVLAGLAMSGKVNLTQDEAIRLISRAGGSAMLAGGTWGNKFDAILKPYWLWLEKKGYARLNLSSGGWDKYDKDSGEWIKSNNSLG